ncbi:hypothetical protein LCGC14_2198750 [marine sediment metagenome]|uniref:Uncharacterized protein n=1 Tax=marine sediment metagenome TaxID=412755 RepID=A0A0F9E4H9_9ZZZZ
MKGKKLISSKIISLAPSHWLYLFAGLSRENKELLTQYYKVIYPRSYVRKLVAALEISHVQSKEI